MDSNPIDFAMGLIPLLTALAFVGACVVVGLRIWKNPDFFITIETEEPRDRKGE